MSAGGDAGAADGLPPQEDLAPSLAEIRERVLGPQAPPGGETPGQRREIYRELQKRHQVDLNDERNLVGLEDPTLVQHMEGARRRLAEHCAAKAARPTLEALRGEFVEALGAFTAHLARADQLHEGQREHVEHAYLHPRQVAAYSSGQVPRGSSRPLPAEILADPGVREALATMEKKGRAVAEDYERDADETRELRNQLFVTRRHLETVGDGLLVYAEGADEERRLLREYLQAAVGAGGLRPPQAAGVVGAWPAPRGQLERVSEGGGPAA